MPPHEARSRRPLCILIAALGGEGGGLLTDWIVKAATSAGLAVQSTSIPGVAQRTGATTYYIEIFPVPVAELDGHRPVLALYPGPGNIDIMVASELLEVGRALENGYVSPERTLLIGSRHRIYSIAEKAAMAEARYEAQTILDAAKKMARRLLLADFAQLAEQHATAINAVLLGAIAGTNVLPISAGLFEAAIQESGIAAEANLRGFALGLARSQNDVIDNGLIPAADIDKKSAGLDVSARHSRAVNALIATMQDNFPQAAHRLIAEGIKRTFDFQDLAYAQTYLHRLALIAQRDNGQQNDYALTCETARYLALWMCYEDVIRVADLKTRRARFQRVRSEMRVKAEESIGLNEFLKPGVDEIAAILPPGLARRLLCWSARNNRRTRLQFKVRLKSHTIIGFMPLWLLARTRRWRRRSFRFQEEQILIERWLRAIADALDKDYRLALEIAECANLNKGYGDTFARGRRNFLLLMERIVDPGLQAATGDVAQRLQKARQAALADPDGIALQRIMAEHGRTDDAGAPGASETG